MTLTLTLDRVEVNWCTYVVEVYIPNYMEIRKTFCGRMYGQTDTPSFKLLGHW